MELNFKKIVLDYLDTTMYHDMNDWDKADVKAYTESTADGYELFIVTFDDQNPSINEDVHYYDSDLADTIMEHLDQGYSVYIDEYLYGDVYLDEQFEEYFSSNVENIVGANPESFTKEELVFVKLEYGIDDDEEEIED
jgi:hypothetical protein|tara:strand:- start:1286 stop:1699 length:414 start_codon:yes stop_codon:yes gene_type:complete